MANPACISQFAQIQIANQIGLPFNVYRPNFMQVDQTPQLIVKNLPLAVKPGGGRFAIPSIAGVNYFTIVGNRLFLPGDILVCQAVYTSLPSSITVLSYDVNAPCIGFRTSRTCTINRGINDNLYTNMGFDYIAVSSPDAAITEDLAGALKITAKKVVFWGRQGMQTQYANGYNIKGLRIIETDGNVQMRYMIESATQLDDLIVCSVNEEVSNNI